MVITLSVWLRPFRTTRLKMLTSLCSSTMSTDASYLETSGSFSNMLLHFIFKVMIKYSCTRSSQTQQWGLENCANFVCFYSNGLLQNRGVASVSYVVRVHFAAAEHHDETPHCFAWGGCSCWSCSEHPYPKNIEHNKVNIRGFFCFRQQIKRKCLWQIIITKKQDCQAPRRQ